MYSRPCMLSLPSNLPSNLPSWNPTHPYYFFPHSLHPSPHALSPNSSPRTASRLQKFSITSRLSVHLKLKWKMSSSTKSRLVRAERWLNRDDTGLLRAGRVCSVCLLSTTLEFVCWTCATTCIIGRHSSTTFTTLFNNTS